MSYLKRLIIPFHSYPFWSQVLITIGSVVILVVIWSACGSGYGIRPTVPPPLARPRVELRGHNGGVFALAFSSSGALLVSGTSDRMARIWDVSKGVVVQTMKGHRDTVTSVAFSPDGRILATGSGDKTVKIWDASSGAEIRTLVGHSAAVHGIAFSPDGRWVASASEDRTIRLWNAATGGEIRTLEGHRDGVNAISFSPDGNLLASASYDKTVRLWDPATGSLVRTLYGHNSPVLSVAFSPDGKLLASGGEAQVHVSPQNRTAQLRLWNPFTGRQYVFETIFGDVRGLAFSPDNKMLANSDGFADFSEVTSWDVTTRTLLSTRNAHRGNINTLVYSPDSQWLASGGDDGRIRLWQ